MRIELERRLGWLREWRPEDAEPLARHANNRSIWLNLRDRFPSPYGLEDAVRFITAVSRHVPPTHFAIEVGSDVVGSIGFDLLADVERVSAELGYWVAEPFWGRGIGTAAVRAMVDYGFTTFGLTRIFAVPYASNDASSRVLEKAGFRLEAHMRRAAVKDGKVMDQLLYAVTDEDRRVV